MRNTSAGATGRDEDNWEGDPELDLRSMRNDLRQTPYQIALRRNNRGVAQLLHPGVPIAVALDDARSTNEGLGPSRLSVLCGIAHSNVLLGWLERYKQREESDSGTDTISTRKDDFVRAVSAPRPSRIDRDRGRSNSCSNSQFRNGSSSSTTECGICMDSNAAISMQPCSHRVCHSCALHICRASMPTPICPFCRGLLKTFKQY